MYSNEPKCTVSKVFLNEHIPLVCQVVNNKNNPYHEFFYKKILFLEDMHTSEIFAKTFDN